MFDNDSSYLDKLAADVRAYGFQSYQPNDQSLIAYTQKGSVVFYGLIYKSKNLPFYQVYGVKFKPTDFNYFDLVSPELLSNYIFSNTDNVLELMTADVSGHENFEEAYKATFKELF